MPDAADLAEIAALLARCAQSNEFRLTLHAQQEMLDEDITVANVREALAAAEVLENYPGHQRGACCLILGWSNADRPLHVVCTSGCVPAVIITVYEPKPPKWLTPRVRRSPL